MNVCEGVHVHAWVCVCYVLLVGWRVCLCNGTVMVCVSATVGVCLWVQV